MSGCLEILNQNDIISRMNMTAAMFTSVSLKKRVTSQMGMDGDFKMPLPKRRNNNYQAATEGTNTN
jgi:hypothetical protein